MFATITPAARAGLSDIVIDGGASQSFSDPLDADYTSTR
jgi:hypothetical protein